MNRYVLVKKDGEAAPNIIDVWVRKGTDPRCLDAVELVAGIRGMSGTNSVLLRLYPDGDVKREGRVDKELGLSLDLAGQICARDTPRPPDPV